MKRVPSQFPLGRAIPSPHVGPLSRRTFLRLAGSAAGGALLGGRTLSERSSGPAQLVYQDWQTDWFPPMVQDMLQEFHATHPNIRVFYVPQPDNVEEKMVADFQSGTAPDVFSGCCSHFPAWAQMGYTLDLRPYVTTDLDQSTINDWDPVQYRALFGLDGRQYGLPKYHGALALYYNKDVFDQYHVEYPDATWTHDDYSRAMKLLTADRDGDGKTDLWGSMVDISWERLQVHVNGWGGHFVDPADPTHCLMHTPEAMAAFEWLRARIWDDRVLATIPIVHSKGPREAFVAGRIAMAEDGSWALKDILSGAKFRIGVAPFPSGPIRKVTLATTDGFGIYAGTRHPEAAWELVKFLTDRAYGRAMARAAFLQPARASLVEEWIRLIREQYPTETRDVDLAAFADGHLKGYSVVAEVFANMADATRIAYEAWDKIFTLGQSPLSEMEVAARQIQEAQPK
jgi:multiple sugar transport system substrate-binding protein